MTENKLTKEELQNKMVVLENKIREIKDDKKTTNKQFKEEISICEEELDSVLDEINKIEKGE